MLLGPFENLTNLVLDPLSLASVVGSLAQGKRFGGGLPPLATLIKMTCFLTDGVGTHYWFLQ